MSYVDYNKLSHEDPKAITEILEDVVQPKMYPSISFSGVYLKLFILCRNRNNL